MKDFSFYYYEELMWWRLTIGLYEADCYFYYKTQKTWKEKEKCV